MQRKVFLLVALLIIMMNINYGAEIMKVVDGKEVTLTDSGKSEKYEEEDFNFLLKKLTNKIESLLKGNDPYNIPFTELSVNNKLTRVSGFVDKSSISDISSTKIQINSMKENNVYSIDCNATIGSIIMMGDYDLDLHLIEQVFIKGKGKYGISLADTNLMALIVVRQNGTMQLNVQDFHFRYSIDKIQVDIAGLFGGGAVGELVENVLNDLIQKIIIDFNPLISNIVRQSGKALLIDKLDGLTMKNVTEIIEAIIQE